MSKAAVITMKPLESVLSRHFTIGKSLFSMNAISQSNILEWKAFTISSKPLSDMQLNNEQSANPDGGSIVLVEVIYIYEKPIFW